MMYKPISIREAIQKINETWFLPAIQRPYDWGERNKKELFIYKLFDSIIRRYPIGGLIIWETSKKIAFRDFLTDYHSEKLAKIRDKGLWGKGDKHLVYDGQQRLQSLFSCLKYTFHNKVLCFNLLFDLDSNKEPEGFNFFERHKKPEAGYLKLNELFSCCRREKVEFKRKVLKRLNILSDKEQLTVEKNFDNLWTLFVETEIRLLSYYPLESDLSPKEVVDIFKRINTTGMKLTNTEILFSDIKRIQFDFEEQIWEASLKIKKMTNGFSFGPDNILKTLFLLIKGGVKVDPQRVNESELKKFVTVWSELKSPLCSFFYDFLYREFKINHEKIVGLKDALIPLIVYFYYMRTKNRLKFKDFSEKSIINMKKYLIISQLNYWNLQSYFDNFHRIIRDNVTKNLDFPFEKIRNFVKNAKIKREIGLESDDFDDTYQPWFALKVLAPNREYSYLSNPDERFNPEIDHIFPKTPENGEDYPKKYFKWVNTVWNLQPIKGEINNLKLNTPPKEFFSKYRKYLQDYDHLPNKNLNNKIWLDKYAKDFIQLRKKNMIRFLKNYYGLKIKDN